MKLVKRQSLVDLTADRVREELKAGRWDGVMPGTPKLAAECGVSRVTMTAALKLLEREGTLRPTSPGKARLAEATKLAKRRRLRIALLLRQRLKEEDADQQLLYLKLRSDLEQAGHICVFAGRTLTEMRDRLPAVRREVEKLSADAWVVNSPGQEVAEWFAERKLPVLFLGGFKPQRNPAKTLSWDAKTPYSQALQKLVSLGHSRIVVLQPEFRQNEPRSWLRDRLKEQLGLAEMPPGSYHFPQWEESPEGLHAVLDKLFKVTPPTALLIMRSRWTLGVLSFLCRKGLKVPEDVSVVAAGMDTNHAWHQPRLAYLDSSNDAYLREIEKWVEGVAKGRDKPGTVVVPGFFDEGMSVAPPPRR